MSPWSSLRFRRSSASRIAGLVVLIAVLGACAPGGAGRGGFQMPPMPVEVAEVSSGTVADRLRALGTLEAREVVKVTNEINAVVRELPFAEGQPVRRGQLLARLEDREIAANATRAAALRDKARADYERSKRLAEQNVVSPRELDDAAAALKVADADVEVAQAQLAKTRIVSPLTGVAGRRLVSPGAFLRIGDSITEVVEVDIMKLTFAAPERYLGKLHRGSLVAVTTTSFPGDHFEGRITVVNPILDPASRTVQVVAEVPNRDRRLRPGMSADVSATLEQRSGALTVPDEAVFAQGDQSYVYVVKADSTVVRSAVGLGTRDSERVEIVQGLKAGDRVVTAGYQKLFDGAKVVPVPAGSVAGGPGGGAPQGGAAAPAVDGKAGGAPGGENSGGTR
jgi:membrane fusion protein (multidrug efflux system)